MTLKREIKSRFNKYGLDATYRGIRRIEHLAGIDKRLPRDKAKIVFDVGANEGQTTLCFYPFFRNAKFYCFEPDPKTYLRLQETVKNLDRVTTFNIALGAHRGKGELHLNEASEGNSMLRVSPTIQSAAAPGWLRRQSAEEVPINSLDSFCEAKGVQSIDLLKLDVQGYEGEVLKGAATLLSKKSIRLIFTEVSFSEYYEGQAYFEDIYAALKCHGYKLADLYRKFWGSDHALTSCDALFVR